MFHRLPWLYHLFKVYLVPFQNLQHENETSYHRSTTSEDGRQPNSIRSRLQRNKIHQTNKFQKHLRIK